VGHTPAGVLDFKADVFELAHGALLLGRMDESRAACGDAFCLQGSRFLMGGAAESDKLVGHGVCSSSGSGSA
jgi:hypothetical protein